jgi:hypothetical protein
MIIIYLLICIFIFYEIYKNINYSQFEHFYNNSITLKDALHICPNLITAGLHYSNTSFNISEGFNKLDTSYNPNLVTNYIYSTPDRNVYLSPYWYNPLDYWLNPYVYYNWYGMSSLSGLQPSASGMSSLSGLQPSANGGSSSYSTSYSVPNIHRKHSRTSRYSRSGRSDRYKYSKKRK